MRRTASLLISLAALMLAGCYTEDRTEGVTGVCKIHHSRMTKTKVPIHYGLIRPDERARALEEAGSIGFPNSQTSILGGCMVKDATRALIYVCPECQKARQKWESENPPVWRRPEKNTD